MQCEEELWQECDQVVGEKWAMAREHYGVMSPTPLTVLEKAARWPGCPVRTSPLPVLQQETRRRRRTVRAGCEAWLG